jgi:biopolymer transport protein ExbD
MPRVKVARKSTAIDMTAMCDVAFLLLTFFILTAKPRTEDPVPIDVPASTAETPLPEENVLLLTVGQGKVYYSIEGTDIRKQTLEQMGDKYNIKFTAEQKQVFSGVPVLGVPMNQLQAYLNLDNDKRKSYKQPGIPNDTTANNELADWIRESRKAVASLHNKPLRISVKGDNKEEYPTIKKIIGIFQKQRIDKFSFITAVKSAPKK